MRALRHTSTVNNQTASEKVEEVWERKQATARGRRGLHLQLQHEREEASSTAKIRARTRALPFRRGVE